MILLHPTVCAILLATLVLKTIATGESAAGEDWVYLDNGKVRLGVLRSSGAAVAFFAPVGSPRNLLNHYDRGRLVQQSYYGDEDGSLWDRKPWRFNPVQGGDWRGAGATVEELRSTADTLYARTIPRHWASGAALPECVMEQWITLRGEVAHLRYQMTYRGPAVHAPRHQEIPAVFVDPALKTLVTYEGSAPWSGAPLTRRVPGWPNEHQVLSEHWAGYVDEHDRGVGICVPIATEATCYRYLGGSGSDCSYIAPLTTFALKPGMTFSYDAYLAAGSAAQMREIFRAILQDRGSK